jgi:hypothetical protein
MRRPLITTAVAVLALAGTALAGDVTVDFDKTANFGAIKTFSLKLANPWGNPLGEKRLTEEMTQALIGKGWVVAPEAEANAQVVIHGATQTRHTLHTFYSGMGGYGWRGWGAGGFGTATTSASEYTEGTLVVDIYEAKSKQLLWRGVAQGELKDTPEKREKQLAKVTDKLFKEFPPGSAKK